MEKKTEEKKIETPKEKPFFKDKSAAGKGDRPRNVSRAFWDNWEEIDWKKDGKPFKITVKIDENTTGEL